MGLILADLQISLDEIIQGPDILQHPVSNKVEAPKQGSTGPRGYFSGPPAGSPPIALDVPRLDWSTSLPASSIPRCLLFHVCSIQLATEQPFEKVNCSPGLSAMFERQLPCLTSGPPPARSAPGG